MFVAYLVPKHDAHLVVEDGLGFMAKGETREAAEAAVLAMLGDDEAEAAEILADHVLHVTEL